MLDHAGAHHIQVDIDEAAMQMLVALDRRGVVAILPECTLAFLAPVVLLTRAPGNELHALRDSPFAGVLHQ
jgi:hypothetical protein